MATSIQPAYWLADYEATTEALAEASGRTPENAADILAYMAGDHLNQTDDDVLATYINEEIAHRTKDIDL